jgi:hypothetical protein
MGADFRYEYDVDGNPEARIRQVERQREAVLGPNTVTRDWPECSVGEIDEPCAQTDPTLTASRN